MLGVCQITSKNKESTFITCDRNKYISYLSKVSVSLWIANKHTSWDSKSGTFDSFFQISLMLIYCWVQKVESYVTLENAEFFIHCFRRIIELFKLIIYKIKPILWKICSSFLPHCLVLFTMFSSNHWEVHGNLLYFSAFYEVHG